jgi:hypothetical protein
MIKVESPPSLKGGRENLSKYQKKKNIINKNFFFIKGGLWLIHVLIDE